MESEPPEQTEEFDELTLNINTLVKKQWIGTVMLTTVCYGCKTYAPWRHGRKCSTPGCLNPTDYNDLAEKALMYVMSDGSKKEQLRSFQK